MRTDGWSSAQTNTSSSLTKTIGNDILGNTLGENTALALVTLGMMRASNCQASLRYEPSSELKAP